VPASECRAASSVITHTASGRSTSYGSVAAAAGKITPPSTVVLKTRRIGDWRADVWRGSIL